MAKATKTQPQYDPPGVGEIVVYWKDARRSTSDPYPCVVKHAHSDGSLHLHILGYGDQQKEPERVLHVDHPAFKANPKLRQNGGWDYIEAEKLRKRGLRDKELQRQQTLEEQDVANKAVQLLGQRYPANQLPHYLGISGRYTTEQIIALVKRFYPQFSDQLDHQAPQTVSG